MLFRVCVRESTCRTLLLQRMNVTVWALPRSTLVRDGIAHVRSSIYVAQLASDSQIQRSPPPHTVTIKNKVPTQLVHNRGYDPYITLKIFLDRSFF
jgi:hypothetical protein